jgi:hypothetical protein
VGTGSRKENASKQQARAFSSEVGTGSREENASKQKTRARSDSIGTERALISEPLARACNRPTLARAEEALLDGKMGACAMHLSRAMHEGVMNPAHGDTMNQAPCQSQWQWISMQKGL